MATALYDSDEGDDEDNDEDSDEDCCVQFLSDT